MILLAHDAEVAAWVSAKLDAKLGMIWAAIGLLDAAGTLVGGGVLHNWTRYDIELSYVGRLTAGMVRALTEAALQAGVIRVTLRTARNNSVRRSVGKFGFAYEGIQRRLYGPTKADDAIFYGLMLPTVNTMKKAA